MEKQDSDISEGKDLSNLCRTNYDQVVNDLEEAKKAFPHLFLGNLISHTIQVLK